MSNWPPVPPEPEDRKTAQQSSSAPQGQEWQLLEKVVMASVQEQQRARRWGIFFKLITLAYVLFILVALGRGCSQQEHTPLAGRSSPHLAVISIDGAIGDERGGVMSPDVIESLGEAFDDQNSKAVVLQINSPGGSPVQSDEIWQEIKRLRAKHKDKKVYAIIGDIGASGAYYIASAADEILVNPSSLVGSIGVIMPNYGLSNLADKIGVEDRTMTSGAHKNILSMTKPIDPFEKAHVQGVLNEVHGHFIAAVREGRGKRLKEDDNTFSGLFWSGSQAIKLGLADKTGSLLTLERELKVDNSVDYTIEANPLQGLVERLGASMGQGLGSTLRLSLEEQSVELK
jgi:protease IV